METLLVITVPLLVLGVALLFKKVFDEIDKLRATLKLNTENISGLVTVHTSLRDSIQSMTTGCSQAIVELQANVQELSIRQSKTMVGLGDLREDVASNVDTDAQSCINFQNKITEIDKSIAELDDNLADTIISVTNLRNSKKFSKPVAKKPKKK